MNITELFFHPVYQFIIIILFVFVVISIYLTIKENKKEKKKEKKREKEKERYDAEIKRKEEQQRARIRKEGKTIIYLKYNRLTEFTQKDVVKTVAALSEANVDLSDVYLTSRESETREKRGPLMVVAYKDEYKKDEDQSSKLIRRSKFVTKKIDSTLNKIFKEYPTHLIEMQPEIEGF